MKQSFRNRRCKKIKWVAVFVAAVVLSFSVAFGVSAQFREWLISLFPIGNGEQIPEPGVETEEHISVYASDNLEDIFEIQYIQADFPLGPFTDNLFCGFDEQRETVYYALEDGCFTPVKTSRIKREVSLFGYTGNIDCDLIEYDGKRYLNGRPGNRKWTIDEGHDALFDLSFWDDQQAILTLMIEPQSDKWFYPVSYDLETGEITDFLDGIFVNGVELKDYPVLRNWTELNPGIYFVTLGTTLFKDEEVYQIDVRNKTVNSVCSITGLESVSEIKLVEGKWMLHVPCDEERFDFYCYDPDSGKCFPIYQSVSLWLSGVRDAGNPEVSFSTGRYDLLKEDEQIFLVDELTGERIPVKGMTEELVSDVVLANQIGDKLLVSGGGMKWLGIIDVKKMAFYLLDQKGINVKTLIVWEDENTFAICAEEEEMGEEASGLKRSYVYLYTVK